MKPKPVTDPLGIALKLTRKSVQMSQQKLESITGISQSALSRWERGEVAPPVDQLVAIATACGTTAAQILLLAETVREARS